MINAAILVLASAAADLSHQYQRDWQTCLVRTSEIWASKKLAPEYIFDAAKFYCDEQQDLMMIAMLDNMKNIGLESGQAKEAAAFLAASLLELNRGFALDEISKARSKN